MGKNKIAEALQKINNGQQNTIKNIENKKIPTLIEYWSNKTPSVTAQLRELPNNMFLNNTSQLENTPQLGMGNTDFANSVGHRYSSSLSELFNKLEESNVPADISHVLPIIKMYTKNEGLLSDDNIFGAGMAKKDPSWAQVWNTNRTGDNNIESLANQYVKLKKERDKEYGINSNIKMSSTQNLPSINPAQQIKNEFENINPKLRVIKTP